MTSATPRVVAGTLFDRVAASLAAETDSCEEALQCAVEVICEMTGWAAGRAYLVTDDGQRLLPADVWHVAPGAPVRALGSDDGAEAKSGQGLIGRVWASGQGIWAADTAPSAAAEGAGPRTPDSLPAAYGLPILIDGDVGAVLEFSIALGEPPPPQLLRMVRSVADHVGRVLERARFHQERAQLAAIVESSYDAIVGKSLDGRITTWNAGAERMYGFTAEEAVGAAVSLVVPEERAPEEAELLEALRRGERLEQLETVRVRKDGRRIHVSLTASPLRNARGRVVGCSTIERDITERIAAQQELHHAKDAAEAASRAKSQFLANVSHELRTPMNAIIGMTQLALREELPPLVHDYLETVGDSAASLMRLLNDILDFSKLESGRFTLQPAPFRLRDTLDEAIRPLAARASEKGLELVCRVPAAVPDGLVGDPLRLQQIVINLVGNGIKFTDAGEVAIDAGVEAGGDDWVKLQFTVRDTGPGVPLPLQERIFEPFAQADGSATRSASGTGLGLPIARELADVMGGRLWVDSSPGRGSAFHFTARFGMTEEAGPAADEPADAARRLAGLPVLVVDDNASNRRLLREMLLGWSMKPDVVADGEAALAMIREAARRGREYRLIIADALMPGIDGCALVERISEQIPMHSARVLMLSSADRQVLRERLERLEIDAYLEKPVSQSDLLDTIMTVLEPRETRARWAAAIAGAPAAPSGRACRILLAEDTPANQKVARAVLQKLGHEVDVAANGREAIDLFGRDDYDLVLMDVQMPAIDGLQATRIIRGIEREPGRRTPIVAMTAHALPGDRERCLEAGMDAYVTKPIDIEDVDALIRRLLSRGGEPRLRDPQCPAATSSAAVHPESADARPVCDLDAALRRMGGSTSILCDMIGFFLDDAPEILESLRRNLEEKNAGESTRAAHSIKGLAANFDGQAVVAEARILEQDAHRADFAACRDRLPALERELRRLIGELERARGTVRSAR
ncbi:MAG: response regulator [Planctomycetales bacterium]